MLIKKWVTVYKSQSKEARLCSHLVKMEHYEKLESNFMSQFFFFNKIIISKNYKLYFDNWILE